MTSDGEKNGAPSMSAEAQPAMAPDAVEPGMDGEAQPAAVGVPDMAMAMEVIRMAPPAAIATFAVPFIKSIATKAGEDCYQALLKLLPRHGKPAVEVCVTDPETGTRIVYTRPLSEEAIRLLAALKPADISGAVVTWNTATRAWDIEGGLRPHRIWRPGM